jgi:hypothetical protein
VHRPRARGMTRLTCRDEPRLTIHATPARIQPGALGSLTGCTTPDRSLTHPPRLPLLARGALPAQMAALPPTPRP